MMYRVSGTRVSLPAFAVAESGLWIAAHDTSYSSQSVTVMMSENGESPSGSK
jgi:hypothetical protein